MEEERFNFKNGTFTSLKTEHPFLPNTPHYGMWHKSPQSYNAMQTEISLQRSKQLNDPLRHNPLNTKQAKYHCP